MSIQPWKKRFIAMHKRSGLVILGFIACLAMIIGIILSQTEDNAISEDKSKAFSFIKNYVFEYVNYPESTLDQYHSLNSRQTKYFSNLHKGVELIDQNNYQEAWKHWNVCLKHPEFANYMAETYFIIGTALGERDGFSSYILLRKALEITRSEGNTNRVLEYCCLNAIIRLLVSQAEDDVLLQELDIKAKQYSQEAHKLLNDESLQISERYASSSIYRIAAESLYWLGNDSLANDYLKQLTEQKQFYKQPELAEPYADILLGVQTYISGQLNESERYLKKAIEQIGASTSFLNYDLELPYAYLGAIYIKQKRYPEAIDYMERSIKALQHEHYTSVEEPLKYISPTEMKGINSTYNVILCYLRLQYFHKEAYRNNINSVELDKILELTAYTNQLTKYWFYKAAGEKTLLRATKLIKKSNSNAIDLIWQHQDNLDVMVDRVFNLQTEASSFYLNYLIELRKFRNEDSTFDEISKLTLELANVSQVDEQLSNDNIRKRLTLLKYKSELWSKNPHELDSLLNKRFTPDSIDENKAIVKYFMSFNHLYVTYYTTHKKGLKRLEKINYAQEIRNLKRAIKSQSVTDEKLQQYYKWLIQPIAEGLSGIDELTILSDEKLEGIPFELLQNENGQFLIKQFAINYSYSSRLKDKDTLPQVNNILALAPGFEGKNKYISGCFSRDIDENYSFIYRNSENNISLSPIPYSTDEVNEIGQLFNKKSLNSTIYTCKEASETNLISHLSHPGVLHIATHGISQDENQSGLFFSKNDKDDGFLKLQEIYNLDVKADLVVLSACKSGTGKVFEGEGIMALPRGFIYAGASNVMASLWKVHDQKTKELMVAFYRHLLEDSVSYSEALRLAKLDCIEKGFLPIDWAGFVLIGSGV